MIDLLKYTPKGDKKNSDYFEEYRKKIFDRRLSSGLGDLLGNMSAVIVQVQTGDAIDYLTELYLMTPYRFKVGFVDDTHKIYCLINQENAPIFFVMEPLDPNFEDDVTRVNKMYPNSREKFNARYIGEIFKTQNKDETKSILMSHDVRFHEATSLKSTLYSNPHIYFTGLSDFTFNRIGYADIDLLDFEALHLGQSFLLTNKQQAQLESADEFSIKLGIKPLIKGIDHLATRILAGEREDAILEFLCLSNYYFWGAYNINDMNSSTNVNRVLHGDDITSPAKVFTANNTPYMVNSFEHLPMPTEDFVRNYGRRMHHMAYEVVDGDHPQGGKNIDYLIKQLRGEASIKFLAQIFGACKDEPDLKQIFSKHSIYSLLITEYVERCHGFDGFFTKENVAALTQAAGLDEAIKKKPSYDGVIGD